MVYLVVWFSPEMELKQQKTVDKIFSVILLCRKCGFLEVFDKSRYPWKGLVTSINDVMLLRKMS
jgi:hypothetical protein